MRCVAYCLGDSFKLPLVQEYFRKKGFFVKAYRDVLYIHQQNTTHEIFVLPMGCFATWGYTSREEKNILALFKSLVHEPSKNFEVDRFTFHYGDVTRIQAHPRLNADLITLEEDDTQIKLAISYGLAQSVKLSSYEESVKNVILKNGPLTESLTMKGKIPLSRHEILQRMGEIYLERNKVNLSSEYLDMPEYFWQYPRLERYYIMIERYLDLPRRVHSLNQRLDVLHGLLDVLNSQLQHRHSSLLEWIIIILICMEILLNLVTFHI